MSSDHLDGVNVTRLGSGPRVVFVHGSMSNGLDTFGEQRALADEFTLELIDRRGFGQSPARDGGVDFEADADDVVAVLGSGAHLVGHSYGAVVSLVAAAQRPSVVRSLTVIEPPAFAIGRGIEIVDYMDERMKAAFRAAPDDPAGWLTAFLRGVGYDVSGPVMLSESEAADVRASMTERNPDEAEPNLDAIRDAGVPALVVRGDWIRASGRARELGGAAFAAVTEVVANRLAAQLVTLPGTHNPQMQSAQAFNELLRGFLNEVDAQADAGLDIRTARGEASRGTPLAEGGSRG